MNNETLEIERQDNIRMLRESAQGFAAKASPLTRARGLRGSATGFDRSFWGSLAEQGWTGLLIPESFDGYGQGFGEMAAVVSELATQVAPEPIVPTLVFASRLIQHTGSGDVQRQLLASIASGELIPAVAWQEDIAGLRINLNAEKVCARQVDGCVKLSGEKHHVRPGADADGFVVSARSDEGTLSLWWVPSNTTGVSVKSVALADGTSAARVMFDGVMLDTNWCLAHGAAATDALTHAYDEALVMTSVELLALQRAMLSMTLEYLRTRVQFGKPIGSFQALQHRAVDLLIQQELTSAVVGQAITLLDGTATVVERSAMASRTKARASDAGLLMARESVQMHGAIGFTDEYDLGLYVQRALVLSAWLGNAQTQRRRYASITAPSA
ncbi:acyl-CoA dehydrogenase [Rugosibacter aromaticivorans]|uniref:Acyl-CoA dehydrogenase n=1 Tax=Rugosibacter aromaticivorans TaxID=1565605 RepID=A0A0C5IXH6_9PROT|nr:acyl-CoA dehydrogenase family protein [Rugosibacter aromaticivorans]AJP47412.1 acyl-CoA dehydrogenase [Rugosibacter aromaticivorans]TBR13852.1 MAG: acyl-CoA dehydrogenase [Rugosibacter sp.]